VSFWGRESQALKSLREEAMKLRNGIKNVQGKKELMSAYLVRFGASVDLLGEAFRAEKSFMKLTKELSLRAALLDMERIYIALESELSVNSVLVRQCLPAVEMYGQMETLLRNNVQFVQANDHDLVDETQLQQLEGDIGVLLQQFGLTAADVTDDPFSWTRLRQLFLANLKKARGGAAFFARGCRLMVQDVQLMFNMVLRAFWQGYTLKAPEVNLLRRTIKDLGTLIPFLVLLILPLSPPGHVLVFGFIQRYFPDFIPSQFTQSRQNIMAMYSSITADTAV